MTNALPLVLLFCQQPSGDGPRPVLMEGIALQAGEHVVTLSEFEQIAKRIEAEEPLTNEVEARRRRADVLRELWTGSLEEQAGRDLGLDPAQIENFARRELERERRDVGLEDFLARLTQEGKDAFVAERDRKAQAYREIWEYYALGNAVADRRATQDRTIRPGELRDLYEENKRELAPIRVQLRWLIVPSASAGGPEGAKARCEEALRRLQAGEDFGILVAEYGSADFRDTLGLTPLVELRRIPERNLQEFARTAEIGALSPIEPLTNPRTGQPDPEQGYHFAELHEREEPPIPPFEDPETQRKLRRFFTDERAKLILGRAKDGLRRESFSWLNPIFEATPVGSQPPPR